MAIEKHIINFGISHNLWETELAHAVEKHFACCRRYKYHQYIKNHKSNTVADFIIPSIWWRSSKAKPSTMQKMSERIRKSRWVTRATRFEKDTSIIDFTEAAQRHWCYKSQGAAHPNWPGKKHGFHSFRRKRKVAMYRRVENNVVRKSLKMINVQQKTILVIRSWYYRKYNVKKWVLRCCC